nr:NADH dehydrogenase subunit 2 [Myrsidea ptilorhynchi]
MTLQVLMLLTSVLLVMGSESFWNLWLSVELFSFFLTPWLMDRESKLSKTNIFFYFLMQFLASLGFLVGSLTFYNNFCSVLLFSSLLMKMSCFPFHSWFVQILPSISWQKIMILITLSKLIPLAMLSMLIPPLGFSWIIILGLAFSIGGFDTGCLRKLMAYSSMAHSSWLVICTCISKSLGLFYMMCYALASVPICFYFMEEKLSSLKHTLTSKKDFVQLVVLMLTLSGVPPFLGFIPKLLAIQALVLSGVLVEASVLGFLSILPVYFYFKMGLLCLGTKDSLEFSFSSAQSSSMMFFVVSLSVLVLLLF